MLNQIYKLALKIYKFQPILFINEIRLISINLILCLLKKT